MMQILEIVLYSRKGERRVLALRPDAVNIVTGQSNTGKSALIEIVDYCLGRSSCKVPTGIVENVSWFGLLLQFPSSQLFIARQAPDPGKYTSSSVYLEQGDIISSPEGPPLAANSTMGDAEKYLTSRIGISPNLNTPPEGQTRKPLEAKIRHALFFCYQDENEIAARNYLFHRQSEDYTTQAVKDTLPYFLGAIQENQLALEHNLTQARRELRKAERALRDAEAIRGRDTGRALGLLTEAIEVGLIDPSRANSHPDEVSALLQQAASWSQDEVTPLNSGRIAVLQGERRDLQSQLADKSRELRAAQTFALEAEGYMFEVRHQQARLESIGVFDANLQVADTCPICSQHMDIPVPSANAMRMALENIRANLERTTRETPHLRSHIQHLESEVEAIKDQLKVTTASLNAALREDEAALRLRDFSARRGRVIGRISLWLESVDDNDETGSLRTRVEEAEQLIAGLEQELSLEDKDAIIDSIVNLMGVNMTTWAKVLGLEYAAFPVRFDPKRLTVVVDRPDQPIVLSRMGSGRNFLSYHLIAHFALHNHFRDHDRPVPGFLFLDQPTLGFYPAERKADIVGALNELDDADRQAVHDIFRFIFERVRHIPGFQVIITDHANLDDSQFQSAVVEDWREGRALIPTHWLNA